ncbi:hypothetical protein TRFO_24207 [Tritrichomonas foetus]|uniref:Sulfatase N-terminal domain-containing protein n=1 Tax=Tritrichomonas foetus TaxID=1144522 RepID=A0A1J4KCQ9_9EUKA|nr:hypothetical protein TRFO_24207 [Tritrichomonas foetus]|eukprot:OHT07484.1 hypothetical protein TRFO_24207 [Tritrichomonas foetus]
MIDHPKKTKKSHQKNMLKTNQIEQEFPNYFIFDKTRFYIFGSLVFGCECFKLYFEQPLWKTLFLTLFLGFFFIIPTNKIFHNFISYLIFLFEGFDCASWMVTHQSINFEFLSSINIQFILTTQPIYLMQIIAVAVIFTFFIVFPYKPITGKIDSTILYLFSLIETTFGFLFIRMETFSLYPFLNTFVMPSQREAEILAGFLSPARVMNIKAPKKKNLIIFQAESIEKQSISKYNSYNKAFAPYLTYLSENSLFCSNVDSMPYTTWSAAGTFVTQCGYPQIVSDLRFDQRQFDSIADWKVNCVSDFLHLAGYNLFSFHSDSAEIQKAIQFDRMHHFKAEDVHTHHRKNDIDFFEYFENEKLEKIVNSSQPFFLQILNQDTHPYFYADPRCNYTGLSSNATRYMKSVHCFSQVLEKFMKKLEKLNINGENTEMMIFGDHLVMMGFKDSIVDTPENPRKLMILFPFREKQEITKKVTYFDVAPTLLDMLGIEYSPPFPFGTNILSDEIGRTITEREILFLYNYKTNQGYKKLKCKSSTGKSSDGVCDQKDW